MKNLFVAGDFILHSGEKSKFLIDCDELTNDELAALAVYVAPKLPRFESVVGIPRGGLRFAEYMAPFITPGVERMLIVDDVYTTGASMEEVRREYPRNAIGLVIFARRTPPWWITPIFTMAG